jgi:hypothetical protein
MEDELVNWAKWSKMTDDGRPEIKNHCGSVEHKYLAEAGEVYNDDPKFIEPDILAAEKLEKLICALEKKDQKILKIKYITHWDQTNLSVAKKLKISEEDLKLKLFLIKSILRRAYYV